MKQKLLTIMLTIAIYTRTLDAFQESVHVTMDSNAKDWQFQAAKNAKNVDNCMQKLFWESICCATAYSKAVLTSTVEIDIHCAEFEGHFRWPLLQESNGHSKWTPELSAHMEETGKQLRLELAKMLCRMAIAYHSGGVAEGVGEHYVFSLRY